MPKLATKTKILTGAKKYKEQISQISDQLNDIENEMRNELNWVKYKSAMDDLDSIITQLNDIDL